MSDDLVARLRAPKEWMHVGSVFGRSSTAPFEAADEIERLTRVANEAEFDVAAMTDQIERLRGVAKAYYKLTHEYSLACQEVRSLRARIRELQDELSHAEAENMDAADRIRVLLRAVEASGSHGSGETPQAAGGASDARQMAVPTDEELIAMQDRGELPSDEELAAQDRHPCGEDIPE